MYTEYFGLTEKPFSISPDPRYLYLSQRHADALAHLVYGISESGGFIQLTGEVGTGKTTLIRSLLEQLPEKTDVALVLNPPLTTEEFLRAICQELRIALPPEKSVQSLIDALNDHLLAANAEDRRVVLIVDEAQTLNAAMLEQIRLLTNLETSKRKLLQIILIGQPELRELLDQPDMRQIAQRITGRYHLEPLSAGDASIYVRHRLRVAGANNDFFTEKAMAELYRLADGIPRLINVIADRALLAAYTRNERTVSARLVRLAAREVFGRPVGTRRTRWAAAVFAGVGIVAITAGAMLWLFERRSTDGPAEAASLELATIAGDAVAAAGPADAAAAPSGTAATIDAATGEPDAGDADTARATTVALADRLAAVAADMPPGGGNASAAQTLFARWGIEYAGGADDDVCQVADNYGLRCLTSPDPSLADIRAINRPAVLALNVGGGRTVAAVLTGLGFDFADLVIDRQPARVGIAELTHAWFGEHWLLWQPEIAVEPDLRPGMRDTRTLWLRNILADLQEGNPGSGENGDLYDPMLEAGVRDFQAARHLVVDGVVGAQTIVRLQAEAGHAAGPTLTEAF